MPNNGDDSKISLEELDRQYVEQQDLPFNLEAEQAVLGSAMKDPESFGDAAEILKPQDFYFSDNRFVFEAVSDLFDRNEPIDFVSTAARLSKDGRLETVGGVDYLLKLVTSVLTTHHVKYYPDIIGEKSVLRNLIRSAGKISKMAYDDSDSLARVLERSEQLIFDISMDNEKSDLVHISDILQTTYDDMAKNAGNPDGITGLATGFDELNKRTGGFHGGELIIIAARPGMGKSTFAVNIAEYVSIHLGKTVAIFNLEMPKEQIVNRILCSQALVNNSRIRTGTMEPEDWEKICDVADVIAKSPMYIDDTATINALQIRAKCRRLKQTRGLSLVVIDYLQLMESGGRVESRQNEISQISRSLKVLAKELDIPVIALSQLKRESESQKGKRPILSDLRESGAIEQDADLVMFLFRNYYYSKQPEEKELAECIIAKNRNGAVDTFQLGFKGEYTQFRNIEYRVEEQ